jgi:hypothetical protein
MKPYFKAVREPTFRVEREKFVRAVADLVRDTVAQVGGAVTIRQVYYQAVTTGLVESGKQGYRQILDAIGDGREVGWVAWNAIEDRGRAARKPYCETGVERALRDLAESYRLDRSAGQRFRVEVWLEPAALREIVWPVCSDLGAVLVVCGGFTSHDSLFKASERFRGYAALGQQPIILHLSDLDPSGTTMGAAIGDLITRLLVDVPDDEEPDEDFDELDDDADDATSSGSSTSVYVQRVGLTPKQANEHGLLPRELKDGDSRAAAYRKQYGDFAYELDGLPACVLQRLVREAIEPLIDWSVRGEVLAREQIDRRVISELVELGRTEGLL